MQKQNLLSDELAALPIGVFDSGIGGLTVVRELMRALPGESIIYFGDTERCPYGPRPLDEVREFAAQISAWLVEQKVKLIVIACNSATAAGLDYIQRSVNVPVIGVIEPGARAAVQASAARRIGVIGTVATIDSGAYTKAIRALDAGITVFSTATPRFVEMVEQGLRLDRSPVEDLMAQTATIFVRPKFSEIARDYLDPLKRCHIDTLVLGCTHYPLLATLIRSIIGPAISIISSAEETAKDVCETLARRRQLVGVGALAPQAKYRFASTASDPADFIALGSAILGIEIKDVQQVTIEQLKGLANAYTT
jgi:glutamate racemase